MSQMLTIILSITAIVSAIASPIASALISNHQQIKLKKLEQEQELYKASVLYKKDIFEKYLCCMGSYVVSRTPTDQAKYGECYLIAYMYAPQDIQVSMSYLNNKLQNFNFDDVFPLAEELTPKIENFIQNL